VQCRTLRDRAGERFKAGAVLCACKQTLPFGERLWAVSASGLWDASQSERASPAIKTAASDEKQASE
jgi:hypothetical protein